MTGEHVHPDLAAVDHAHADLDERVRDISARVTGLIALGEAITADIADIRARLVALEPEPAPPPFIPDFYIAGDGDDAADGLTRATAKRSIATAPKGKVTGLYGGGIITGGALYDGAYTLRIARGEDVRVQGPGRYSLRLQRAHGTSALPLEGGSLTVMPPLDPGESVSATGEKPGLVRRAAVELTDCDDLDLDLRVVAGTDFGILTAGTLRRCFVVADVSDAGHGFMLKGNLGTGADRSWFGGHAHDCNRMVRNLRNPGPKQGAYGAVGFVNENAIGGGLLSGWRATNCFARCFQYGYDGGGIEGFDGVDFIVEPGTVTDCEGGFETGGSEGRGIHGWNVTGLKVRGHITRNGESPAILIRNFEGSTLDCDVDVTSARVSLEVYLDEGQFGGSIANSRITGRIVERQGVPATSLREIPPTTVVDVEVVRS